MLELSPYFVFARASVFGLIFLIAAVVLLRRNKLRYYWLLLAFAIGYCLASPFFYIWITSYPLSYLDAALLRKLYAGSSRVAEAYCTLFGVVVGGLLGFAFRRASRERPQS